MRADSWEGADPAPAVDGRCAPRFHLVGEAFADVVASGRAGSALAIWHDGRMVVDLWGGRAGCGSGQRWAREPTGSKTCFDPASDCPRSDVHGQRAPPVLQSCSP